MQDFVRAKLMRKSFGAAMYGGNLDKWPARLVDAFMVLEEEESRVNGLMQNAARNLPQRGRRSK